MGKGRCLKINTSAHCLCRTQRSLAGSGGTMRQRACWCTILSAKSMMQMLLPAMARTRWRSFSRARCRKVALLVKSLAMQLSSEPQMRIRVIASSGHGWR